MSKYIISGISLPLNSAPDEAISVAAKKLRRAGIEASKLSLYRRSVDARNKNDIKLVYAVAFSSGELKKETVAKLSLQKAASENLTFEKGSKLAPARPVVIGMGPCGLFAALILAENGYKPLLIERGGDVSSRVKAVDTFYKEGKLDTNCNVQFGAGGAGTFSDGKLVTRITDSRCAFVLAKLCEMGAPEEILTNAKPHIGTDILRSVVDNAAKKIIECGGEIMYNTSFLGFGEIKNGVRTLRTSSGDIASSATVLAIGHSARDTYEMLIGRGCNIEAKDFSVGFRIEHLKSNIDKALFGSFAGHKALPYGEYNLSYNTKSRGVYTFCMCPGGEVVSGASEEGGLCVNGMSHFARNGRNSNSAVCVSVFKNDYGATPLSAIEFQRKLERSAFTAGGSDYSAPVMSVGQFLKNGTGGGTVSPTYMGGKVREADLSALLPEVLVSSLRDGLLDFGRKIKGFDSPDAMLSGLETRTSAPLRILRDENLTMIGESDIYPGGEGAGYAGGITSAAVDGIKIAEKIMAVFKPLC